MDGATPCPVWAQAHNKIFKLIYLFISFLVYYQFSPHSIFSQSPSRDIKKKRVITCLSENEKKK